MVKVYATVDGAELRIGSYGTASRLPVKDKKGNPTGEWTDTPVEVPDEVAAEFKDDPAFRIDDKATKKATAKAAKEKE